MTSALDHRNFILNMSISEGQRLASDAGYGTPDDQGIYLEKLSVLRNWASLGASGCLDVIKENAQWMTHLIAGEDWTPTHVSSTYSAFVSLLASTCIRLQEDGLIDLVYDPEIQLAQFDPDTQETTPIDGMDYTYRDDIGHLDDDEDFYYE